MVDTTNKQTIISNRAQQAGLRVAKNTVILTSLRIVMPFLAVALMLVLSRKLGAEGVGRYSLAFSFLYLFNTVGPLGLYAVITRDGARSPQELTALLSNAFSLGTIASTALIVVMILLGGVMGYDVDTRLALLILSFAILPYTIGSFQEAACIALQRTQYVAISTGAEYVLKVGAGILLLYLGHGLEAVLFMAVFGRLLACFFYSRLLYHAGVRARWVWDKTTIRKLVGLSPTFVLISVFATLYWRVDIFMLSKMQSIEEVGYYGAAWRLLEFAMVVPTSACLALYPQVSALIEYNLKELSTLADTAMRYLLAVTLPVAVAVTLLGDHFLAFLYGESFRQAALTLSVLIWTLIPYVFVRYHAYILVASNRQRIDLLLNIVMSLVNVLLNLSLIPRFGILGAAVATFTSICIYALLQYLYVWHYLPGRAATYAVQPLVLFASVITGLAIWLVADWSVVLAIVLSPVIYLTVLYGRGFFSPSELSVLGVDTVLTKLGLSVTLHKET